MEMQFEYQMNEQLSRGEKKKKREIQRMLD